MSLKIDQEKLNELMHDFHVLTGIRMAIFDDRFKEVLNYPERHCDLCSLIRSDGKRLASCEQSNCHACEESRQSGKLVIYECHAGLIEATAPIRANGVIIGFIMFGQITGIKDKEILTRSILGHFRIDGQEKADWCEAIRLVKYKNLAQIRAAAKILEALTYYVLQMDLVALGHERLVDRITAYIMANLNGEICANSLARRFGISRTHMYEITRQYLGQGIAEFIRQQRLEKACQLLAETDLGIAAVAGQTGFSDYTYFSKVFRKAFQMTPSDYRLSKHQGP